MEWRDVPGWEDYVQVSEDGRFYSKKSGQERSLQGGAGYKWIKIWKDGKFIQLFSHRAVALAFIPNPENKRVVNHKDGNKHNNYKGNLEWCTQSENLKHAYSTGLKGKGEEHGRAVLTEEIVREARASYRKGSRTSGACALAKKFGVNQATLWCAIKGQTWTHI